MKARGQQGRPHKCPWVRNGFFEWYTSVRYSIDWSKVRARPHTPGLTSRGMGKYHNYVINRHDHCRNCNSNMIQKLAKTVAYDAVKKSVAVEVKDFVLKNRSTA